MLSRRCLFAGCASVATALAVAACNALLDNGEATYAVADAAPFIEEAVEDAGSDSGIFAGTNGEMCIYSAYNCQLRADAGEDIVRTGGRDDDWGIEGNATIRDGNGDVLGHAPPASDAGVKPRVPFQYGQRRDLADAGLHALAVKTSNASPGWIALADIPGITSFKERMGPIVGAQREGLARMACYRILDHTEADLEAAKFVYDATQKDVSGADYLPAVRANGRRSASLAFNVPGSVMRGTIIDHFPAGTLFQRVSVASTFGGQHVDAPLWTKDAEGRYRTLHDRQALPFVYGYVLTSTGEKRAGWMAYAALGPISAQPCE